MPRTGRKPTWGQVKASLRGLDPDTLLGLIHDLYETSPDNQRFLHVRVLGALTELEKYRRLIVEAVSPNPLGRKPIRIGEGQRLIRQYQDATRDVAATVDLMLAFVEAGTDQAADLGYGDEQYFSALERALRTAVKLALTLSDEAQAAIVPRLRRLVTQAARTGWGFGDMVSEIAAPMLRVIGQEGAGLRQRRSNTACSRRRPV